MRAHYRGCCIDGGRKRRKQDAGANALSLPSRPAVTASGWHAGSRRAALRPTSFTPRVWRCRASIGEPRPTVSTPSYSNVLFSAGCAASVITARCAIPTLKDEDAKRPSRERESLVGEQSRIVNRMKAALIRLAIRAFNPKLKRAGRRLDSLRTPEGEPIPPNTLAELRRDMERRRLTSNQIRQIEEARLKHFEQTPNDGPHAMVRLLARVIVVGIETADMLVHEVLSRHMHDRRAIARYSSLTGSADESGRTRRAKA